MWGCRENSSPDHMNEKPDDEFFYWKIVLLQNKSNFFFLFSSAFFLYFSFLLLWETAFFHSVNKYKVFVEFWMAFFLFFRGKLTFGSETRPLLDVRLDLVLRKFHNVLIVLDMSEIENVFQDLPAGFLRRGFSLFFVHFQEIAVFRWLLPLLVLVSRLFVLEYSDLPEWHWNILVEHYNFDQAEKILDKCYCLENIRMCNIVDWSELFENSESFRKDSREHNRKYSNRSVRCYFRIAPKWTWWEFLFKWAPILRCHFELFFLKNASVMQKNVPILSNIPAVEVEVLRRKMPKRNLSFWESEKNGRRNDTQSMEKV